MAAPAIEHATKGAFDFLGEREAVQIDGAPLTVERELSFLVGPDFVVPQR